MPSNWRCRFSQSPVKRLPKAAVRKSPMSWRIVRSMSGYWILTATGRPEPRRRARCTWPSEAAAKASVSKSSKTSVGSAPSSARACSRSSAKCIGGASACRRPSTSTNWLGRTSGQWASTCPSFITAPRR